MTAMNLNIEDMDLNYMQVKVGVFGKMNFGVLQQSHFVTTPTPRPVRNYRHNYNVAYYNICALLD
jgi:hypothetical protein